MRKLLESSESDYKDSNGNKKFGFVDLFLSIDGVIPILFQLLFISSVLQVFTLASPYYMQIVLDEVIVSFDQGLLTVVAVAFSMITIFSMLITVMRGFVVVYLGAKINVQLSHDLFSHLLKLPSDYFSRRHIGDVVSRFGSLNYIKKIITNHIVEALIDGVMALTTLMMIFLYNWKMALVVLTSMILYFLVKIAWYGPIRKLSSKSIVARADENTNFIETISGIQNIKLYGKEAHRQGVWSKYYLKALKIGTRLEHYAIWQGLSKSIIFGVESILVVYIGAISVIESTGSQTFTVGMLVAFMAYKTQLTNRYASLIDKYIEFKMLGLHLDRINDIMLTNKESGVEHDSGHIISGSMRIEKLEFSHGNEQEPILNSIDLDIEAGQSIAIIGSSGVGKTTLIKLLLGLIEPDSGSIKVDGHCINRVGKKCYRRQVATVMQSDDILSGSISDVISNFADNIDDKRLVDCAKTVSIHNEIMAMKNQYSTLVGGNGVILSGGQKQKILLARALYHKPKILFLDEATSHLDIESELIVNQAISMLNITRIIVAHRRETILSADFIYRLSKNGIESVSKAEYGGNAHVV